MHDPLEVQVRELETKVLLPLVVGAHLEAEVTDRALAYGLRKQIGAWQTATAPARPLLPVVCSDLWYLNSDSLRRRPAIALGRPEINAASAYLAGRLPTAFIAEQQFRIQFDPELVDLDTCIWGITGRDTAAAVDLFVDRYLAEHLAAVHAAAADPS